MSGVIGSARMSIESASLLGARRLRADQHQHWSSPYAARRVHLIGIGGCGMSSLAGVLLRCGAIVSGSDRGGFKIQPRLEELGATIAIGQAPINIPTGCDIVVSSAAIREDNPELLEARRRGLPCLSYAQMLGEVMRLRKGIAVAGTHGKSTTTAMVAYILRQARTDPTFVVGAEVAQLEGSSGVGDGPYFVVEACEFNRSFLNLAPAHAAILNIEEDHLDYFKGLEDISSAFHAFAGLVPAGGVVVANADDAIVTQAVRRIPAQVETFGLAESATWRAVDIRESQGCYQFGVEHEGRLFLHASMNHLPGRHQIANALAATALAGLADVPAETIADSLSRFSGADRRLSRRGEGRGILILDDYGHHPTEIKVTLRTVRERYPGRRLWVVFQPHQHSRTRFLLEDFARSFGQADHLLVPDIYFVRDSEAERSEISSSHLVDKVRSNGGDALYLAGHDEIVDHIVRRATEGDVILTMGAGDVWKIADELVRRLA